MKKLISAILTLCMLISMLSATAVVSFAEDLTEGYYTYYVDDQGNAHITDVDTSISGNVTIPLLFDNKYPVVEIGSYSFDGCTSIKSVLMLQNIRTIGYSAFANCSGITEVTFSENLTKIESRAFSGCTGLKSVEIPDSVTVIEACAFEGCERLTSAIIGNGIEVISRETFRDCTRLKSIVIGDSVEEIGYGAFYNCEKLKEVQWGGSVKVIGGGFYNYGAFENCYSIETLHIPNTVTEIDDNAFNGCSSINNLKISENTETIGSHAFENCSSIPSVYIPDSVTTIGDCAFKNSTSLKKVDIGNKVTVIGTHAFENSGVETVIIGDAVEEIGYGAFYNCIYLTNIVWGNNLKTIGGYYYGEGAFENCTNLATVHIPDTVVTVEARTFVNCTNLSTLTIGENVSDFGELVFENCTSLTSVIIPESTIKISSRMFKGCTSLETIYLPADLQTIDYEVFEECNGLKDVYYAGSEEEFTDFVDIEFGNGWSNGNDILKTANYHYDCDTRIPTGSIDSQTPENTLATSHNVVLTLWDNVGVAGYYWGTDPDYTQNPYTETTVFTINKTIDQAGTYYLVVKDVNGFISTRYSITFHDVTLNANGGTLSGISTFLGERAESIIPTAPTHSNAMYVFAGWATYQNATVGSESISPSGDKTYYAVWVEKEPEPEFMLGDINENGKIDMTDYILLKRAYFGTYTFTDIQNKAGDINENNKIDMTDYILLKRVYFGTYTLK